MTDDETLAAIKDRYTAEPVPPCRVCGESLSLAAIGGGRPNIWVCAGQEDDPGRPGYVRYKAGRSCVDDHYSRSEFQQCQLGDADVLALVDEVARLKRGIEFALTQVNPATDVGSILRQTLDGEQWLEKVKS